MNIKKIAVTGGLLVVGGIAGLGAAKLTKGNKVIEEKEVTTEVKNEEQTYENENTYAEENSYETEDYLNDMIEIAVENSYITYQQYYDSMGYTTDDIRKMSLVMNEKLDGLTEEDVTSSCNMIKELFCSNNLIQKIDNINNPMGNDCDLLTLPKVSDFIFNENEVILPIIKRIEEDRDLVISTIQETGNYDSVKEMINNETVDMYNGVWDKDMGLDVARITNKGALFTVASAKFSLLNIVAMLNPGQEFVYSENIDPNTETPYAVKVAFNSKEQEIANLILHAQMTGVPVSEETSEKYASIVSTLSQQEFIEAMCGYERILQQEAEKNLSDTNSYNYSNK